MRKALRNGWKRVCSVVLAAAMVFTMLPAGAQAATSSSANADGTFDNPVIYADVPDIDIIRVGDAYYMVSTTMHLSPGCPIMKSTDLVNWEIVNYVYDILGDTDAMNLRNGESMYGNGQWAASLKYNNGTYYVAFNSNTTGTAYLYATDDIEKGAWTKTTLNGGFHDMSLFFDDNGKAYVLYGGGAIKCAELSDDLKTVKKDTEQTLFDITKEDWGEENIGTGLAGEGTHIMKKGEYYYVFNVCWPQGGVRTEVCHRSKTFPGTQWENQVILKANFQNNGVSGGVAQGAVIDTADGAWYGFMFQDHGAIGRTPVLTDCTWINDWPMLGKDGDGETVESVMQLPVVGSDGKSLTKSDEFYNDAEHRVFEAQTMSATAQTYNAPAEAAETEIVELVENGDFENGTTGWTGFEGGEIDTAVSADNGKENKVLWVKNRTNSSSSAMYDLTGKIEKGTVYTIKGKMKYIGGEDESGTGEKSFTLRFQNRPTKDTPEYWNYRHAAGTITLKEGEWKEFTVQYTPADNVTGGNTYPFGTGENYFFIEATKWEGSVEDSTSHATEYYLDDISITYERPADGGGEEPGGDTAADASVMELITNGGFETGNAAEWRSTPGEQACQLEVVNTDKASGDYSLYVSGRPGTGSGACQDISGKMTVGKTYTISGKLKYTEGPDTKNFLVTLQHGANYNYRQNIVTINAKKGEWVTFKGTYTAKDKSEEYAFDPNSLYIFVETGWTAEQSPTDDLMSYYLDDFSVTVPNENMAGDSSFNSGLGPWGPFEGHAKVELVNSGRGGEDDKCLKVSEREQNWQGPGIVFGDKMTPGNSYTIKAYVKYDEETPAEQNFTFTMKGTIGSDTDPKYQTMAAGKAKSGEWTEFTGKWTMPDNANQDWTLYVNTDEGSAPYMDFYLDDVTIIEEVKDQEPAEAGEHDYNGSDLDLVWQWNHNPNNNNWSLTERDGWLRLKTGSKAASLLDARNTLTQRTFGPVCSGSIRMDISNMQNGDVAGLGSLSYNYGYIAVKKEADGTKLVMVDASGNEAAKEDKPEIKESVDCTGNTVYLKEDFNYAGNADGSDKDTVSFYYSFDGKTWNKLGSTMKMSYELTHFMGSKFAIFNYTTVKSGGYVDVDYFRVSDKITGTGQPADTLTANMTATPEVSGVIGSECEVKLSLDALEAGNHTGMEASIGIPSGMDVENVVFNTAAMKGQAAYTVKGSRLLLEVKGSDVSFAAEDKLFATIKLKVNSYADADKTVEVKADYIRVDNGASEYDVSECTASVELKALDTDAIAKKLGYGNPIFTQAFGADPYAMEYDGRVYVYMTADDYEYDENGNLLDNSFSKITTLRVVSSADLMNWTDHGEIAVAGTDGTAKWASNAWAPAIAHKTIDGKEKFFLYFANGGSGIGVLEGDSPLGPWTDPLGQPLLTYGYPECEGVVWCFDPAVLVDDDGTGYIYFGGGVPEGQNLNPKTARVAQLTDDMVHIKDNTSYEIDAPCMFEDSGIFKYNDKYYYSYCSNFTPANKDGYPGTGTICYMVSDDPMGPFTYAGEIFSNPSVWFGTPGNNHHATFVFEGESYFIYHAQTVAKEEGKMKGYRSTHIDKIEMRADGTIKPIKGTYEGIPQLHTMNPYERIEAETIAWNAGIKVMPCEEPGKLFSDYNTALTDLQDKDWTSVAQLDFGSKGADKFQVSAASAKGGSIEVRLDSPEGTLIGTAEIAATGSEDTYKTVTCDVDNVTGTRNVFLVFRGSETENIMNVDYFLFTEKEGGSEPTDPERPTDQQISDMNDKITEAKKLLADLEGTEKEKLQSAITEAENTLKKDGLTRTELEAALSKLNKAVKAAEEVIEASKPVQEQLANRINEAKELLDKLSDAEKAKLQPLIEEAESVLKKDGATEEEIQDVLGRLKAAITSAEEIIEAEKQLNDKIAEAEQLLDKLSEEEKEKLQAAIDAAKAVLNTEGVTKEQIEEALGKLKLSVEDAIESTKPVEEQLSDKIAEAKKLLANLSDAKKQKLQAAIDEAEAVLNKTGVTEEEIKAALDKLKTAIEEAEKPDEKPPVNPPVENSPKVNETFTTSSGLKYKVTAYSSKSKNVAVTGTTKNLTSLTIPATVKYKNVTFKVTTVANSAFTKQIGLKSAVIGQYVTSIGAKAFYNDKNLSKVTFKGTAVKTIGKNAFTGIKKNAAFSMKKTFTSKNVKYKITKCTTSAKQVTVTGTSKKKLTSLSIPATVKYNGMTFKVTAVGKNAFKNQKQLKSVTVGKNVTGIGANAFSGDSKLAKIKFSGTAIKSIGKNAFKGIKKNAVFSVKKSKKASYRKLLNKAKTKNFKMK